MGGGCPPYWPLSVLSVPTAGPWVQHAPKPPAHQPHRLLHRLRVGGRLRADRHPTGPHIPSFPGGGGGAGLSRSYSLPLAHGEGAGIIQGPVEGAKAGCFCLEIGFIFFWTPHPVIPPPPTLGGCRCHLPGWFEKNPTQDGREARGPHLLYHIQRTSNLFTSIPPFPPFFALDVDSFLKPKKLFFPKDQDFIYFGYLTHFICHLLSSVCQIVVSPQLFSPCSFSCFLFPETDENC